MSAKKTPGETWTRTDTNGVLWEYTAQVVGRATKTRLTPYTVPNRANGRGSGRPQKGIPKKERVSVIPEQYPHVRVPHPTLRNTWVLKRIKQAS